MCASRPGWRRRIALVTGTPTTMDGISACAVRGGWRIETRQVTSVLARDDFDGWDKAPIWAAGYPRHDLCLALRHDLCLALRHDLCLALRHDLCLALRRLRDGPMGIWPSRARLGLSDRYSPLGSWTPANLTEAI